MGNCDLATIASRTGVSPRRLRYALEAGVLPGMRDAGEGRGTARTFTAFEAFGIAIAGLLIEAGLRRSLVAQCLDVLVATKGRPSTMDNNMLGRAFTPGALAILEIADGANIRLKGLDGKAAGAAWIQAATGAALAESYKPMRWIGIDVGQIRRKLLGL